MNATVKDFRFGTGFRAGAEPQALARRARQLEDLGYDVLNIADHLDMLAPFPVLTAAAQATTTVRLGTYVLNACFYKPALLARDIATLQTLADDRLDIGLGAGYVREEFEAAELPFPGARARIAYLEHVTEHLKAQLTAVPILIAGNGDRLLSVAARHADIIGFTGTRIAAGDDPLGERIDIVRRAAGDRFGALELNLAITAVPTDPSGIPDLSLPRKLAPALSDDQLLTMPAVLSGSPQQIADTLRGLREAYGITYFNVQHAHADAFAKVITALR